MESFSHHHHHLTAVVQTFSLSRGCIIAAESSVMWSRTSAVTLFHNELPVQRTGTRTAEPAEPQEAADPLCRNWICWSDQCRMAESGCLKLLLRGPSEVLVGASLGSVLFPWLRGFRRPRGAAPPPGPDPVCHMLTELFPEKTS